LLQSAEQDRQNRRHLEYEKALEFERLAKARAREVKEHMTEVNAELDTIVAEEQERVEKDSRARDDGAARLRLLLQDRAPSILESPDSPPGNPAFGDEKCTPWVPMRAENGTALKGLEITYCFAGSDLPSLAGRDFSTVWLVRNSTAARIEVSFQIERQCVSACANGWYGYKVQVDAQSISRPSAPFQAFQVWGNRVREISVP
jgi:hypothetical protein